jgi:hypothetical protein
MINFAGVGKRLRTRRNEALFNLLFGLLISAFAFMWEGGAGALFLLIGIGFLCGGTFGFLLSRQLPVKEIMQLAESRNGLLTLSEITTTLDIDPALAARALKKLQALKIASPRWQEIRKNLWEFPDYVQLPLEESLELAEKSGGRVTLKDLVSQGYSVDTAQQTLNTLSREGLARPDAADAGTLHVANG